MNDLISGLARLVVRLVLVAAGLVFAAALLVALLLLVAFWSLRAAWARLAGRPVTPFVMRMDPRTGFGQVFRADMFRAGQGMQRGPMQDDGMREPGAPVPRREIADVTDVVAKEPRAEDPRQP